VLRIAVDLGSAPEHRSVSALPSPRPAAGPSWWGEPEWADREWTWPPGGSWPAADGTRWRTDEWAPATTVRRPLVRVGRWTLLYRRPGC
jgi:hypothetical protein